jgi:hypothetical protein
MGCRQKLEQADELLLGDWAKDGWAKHCAPGDAPTGQHSTRLAIGGAWAKRLQRSMTGAGSKSSRQKQSNPLPLRRRRVLAICVPSLPTAPRPATANAQNRSEERDATHCGERSGPSGRGSRIGRAMRRPAGRSASRTTGTEIVALRRPKGSCRK